MDKKKYYVLSEIDVIDEKTKKEKTLKIGDTIELTDEDLPLYRNKVVDLDKKLKKDDAIPTDVLKTSLEVAQRQIAQLEGEKSKLRDEVENLKKNK